MSPARGLLAAALLLCGCGHGGGAAPKLNVVLISIDSLRADHLGCYGHRAEFAPGLAVSPNLDALASDGALFESAWSTTSWTLPAHMALLTGLTDRLHGVVNDGYALNASRRSVAQEFHDAGYATAGFYSAPYLDPHYGFARGFDRYESAMTPLGQAPPARIAAIRQELQSMGAPVTDKTVTDRWSHWDVTSPRVNELALPFLEQHAGKDPFFLFLHYFDAHYDYLPDAAEPGLGAQFDPDYHGSMSGADWYFNPAVKDPQTGQQRISERDLHHVMALYDAEIHWVDRYIGFVIQRLKDLGVYDQTIVCVVADHGDEFFEHGGIGHRSTLYEELTHVPFLLRVPGGTPPGKRVPSLVRLYDVAPSLLDYGCGGALADSPGASVRPLVEGRKDPPRSVQQRICGLLFGRVNIRDGYRDAHYAVLRQLTIDPARTTGELAYLSQRPWDERTQPQYAGQPRFDIFDHSRETGEHHGLSPADPRYAEAVAAACAAYQDMERRAGKLRQPLPDLAGALDAAEQERLAQLGYAGSPKEEEDDPQAPRPVLQEIQLAPFPPPCLGG